MPSAKFPAPKYNSMIESDPQIVKIDIDKMDWGARKSMMNKVNRDQTEDFGSLEHVKSK